MGARGDSMVGSSRTVRRDALVAMTVVISERGDRLVYRATSVRPAVRRIRVDRDRRRGIVFENPGHDFPQRIGYRRRGTELLAWIEGSDRGQSRAAWMVPYTACAAPATDGGCGVAEISETQADSADREIVATRLIDAPRARVFKPGPTRIAGALVGTQGFTNTFTRSTTGGAAGVSSCTGPMASTTGTRVSSGSGGIGADRLLHLRTMQPIPAVVTFADEGGKTRLVWRCVRVGDRVREGEEVCVEAKSRTRPPRGGAGDDDVKARRRQDMRSSC